MTGNQKTESLQFLQLCNINYPFLLLWKQKTPHIVVYLTFSAKTGTAAGRGGAANTFEPAERTQTFITGRGRPIRTVGS